MSVETLKQRRYAVDYDGTRTFVNTSDASKALAYVYSKLLSEMNARVQAHVDAGHPAPGIKIDLGLSSLAQFKTLAKVKESPR